MSAASAQLVRRKIDVTITLGTGDFGEGAPGASNTVTLSGLRVSAKITKTALQGMDSATVTLYGVTRSIANQITRLGKPLLAVRDNRITINAGDDVSGMSQVFTGIIYNSYGVFDGMPETSIEITCLNGLSDLSKPVPPISFPAGADVAVICSQIAASMGKTFQNNGVSKKLLSNAYYPGTAVQQLRKVADHADINAVMNGGPNGSIVIIWPKAGSISGSVPVVSKDTGMQGSPRYSDAGISVTSLYRPGFIMGGQFSLETQITPANGTWNIYHLTYDLESEVPNGRWNMTLDAVLPSNRGGSLDMPS